MCSGRVPQQPPTIDAPIATQPARSLREDALKWFPKESTIFGGLVTSTWLTLFVVPVLYLRLGPTAVPEPSPATAGGLVDDLLPREPAAPLPGGAHAAVHQASVQREPGP